MVEAGAGKRLKEPYLEVRTSATIKALCCDTVHIAALLHGGIEVKIGIVPDGPPARRHASLVRLQPTISTEGPMRPFFKVSDRAFHLCFG